MPANVVNVATVAVGTSPVRLDPLTANSNRYKVIVINPGATDGARVIAGYASNLATSNGAVIEQDFGREVFFINSAVSLYGVATASVTVNVEEHCTP